MGKCYVSKNKEVSSINLNELGSLANRKSQYWLDFENISKEDIEKIKTLIKLHPITIEDLQEEGEEARIKYEQFDDYTFIVFSGIKKITKDEIEPYVLKFIIGKNFIITVHKENMNTINSISSNKKRLTNLMSKGVDYLLYRLIDLEVDLYYPIVEKLEKKADSWLYPDIYALFFLANAQKVYGRTPQFGKTIDKISEIIPHYRQVDYWKAIKAYRSRDIDQAIQLLKDHQQLDRYYTPTIDMLIRLALIKNNQALFD